MIVIKFIPQSSDKAISQMREKSVKDPQIRKLLVDVLKLYRANGHTRRHENLKHVLRMSRTIKAATTELRAVHCDPEILVTAILISDLGKEPNVQQPFLNEYDGNRFKAFLDHARISMRVGNDLRKRHGIPNHKWKKVLASILGHDGPSIPGSWWKTNYERQVQKRYPKVHGIEGLIHCYLDRIDQGGIFPGMGSKLTGGLRKISFDLYSGGTIGGNLAAVIYEVFSATRFGTLDQLKYLDEVVSPKILRGKALPPILSKLRLAFKDSERYMQHVLIEDEKVSVVLNSGKLRAVKNLEEFWQVLSEVVPEMNVKEMCEIRKTG
jgi:hypothetical protein